MNHAISPFYAETGRYLREVDDQERMETFMERRRAELLEDFDEKDLLDCAGDDPDLLANLYRALLPLRLSRRADPITEALQAIVEKAISIRIAKEIAQ
jgi:hypothetical protein